MRTDTLLTVSVPGKDVRPELTSLQRQLARGRFEDSEHIQVEVV